MPAPTLARVDSDVKRVLRAAAAANGYYDDRALANALGVSRMTVARWYEGVTPSGEAQHRMAQVLGIDPKELADYFYEEGRPPTIPQLREEEPPTDEATAWARSVDSGSQPRVVRPLPRRE